MSHRGIAAWVSLLAVCVWPAAQAQLAGATSTTSQVSSSVGAQTTSAVWDAAPAEPPASVAVDGTASPTAATSEAQQTGSLIVAVADPSDAVIPGATVTLVGPLPAEDAVAVITDERGEALAEGLAPGTYRVRVELEGFEPTDLGEVAIGARRVRKSVTLALGRFSDELTVTRDETDRAIDDAFSNTLSEEQIDQLPDDPDEMAQTLEQMAGPGAVLRVNGFEGGRLPPKEQIQQIRFRFDPYSADNHEGGRPRVDIQTRPGGGEWRNTANVGFRDQSLDARNAFADERGDGETQRGRWSVNGPLVKGRTSFALTVGGANVFESQTIVATPPSGPVNDIVARGTDEMDVDFRLEHGLTKTHTLRVEFMRETGNATNLGVGDFDLPERAYTRETADNRIRVSDIGTFGRRFANELRVEYAWGDTTIDSFSDALTVDVQNQFTSGGAQIESDVRAWEVELFDQVEFTVARKHNLRTGFEVEANRYRSFERRNMNGTYVFASLDDYEAGRPLHFSVRVGEPLVTYSRLEGAWWIQDDWRLRKTLQLGFGLRHEMQTQLRDWNNFAPRTSVTWTPSRSGKTTVRAGAGLFYDWYEASTYEQTIRVDGFHQQDFIIRDPSYPRLPLIDADGLPPSSRIQAASNLEMPTTRRVSAGLEHQLTPWMRLRANAFDEHSWNVLRGVDINAPVNGERPDPAFGRITQIESVGRRDTRGFDVNAMFNHQPWQLFGSVFYRHAWAMNDADGPLSLPANSFDVAAEWGPARDDIRHRIFGFFNVRLPTGFGLFINARANSGAPYNITTGFDDNGDTVTSDRPEGVGRNSARGDWQSNVDMRVSWGFGRRGGGFDGGGRGGPGGRGGGGGGGPQVVRIGEGPGGQSAGSNLGFELYVQAFNVFNTTSYTTYSGVATSSFFGEPIAAMPARRFEAGVRVNF
jgi:hypothetical protein